MEKFTVLKGIAAPLPMVNVDTDMIMPKQFLKTITRTGLGTAAFFDMRYDDNEAERPEFILNQAPFRQSKILIAGKKLWLRLIARTCPLGSARLWVSLHDCPQFRRYFLQQLF